MKGVIVVCWLISSGIVSAQVGYLPSSHPKSRTAQRVAEQIYSAGRDNRAMPTILVRRATSAGDVARFIPPATLEVGEKLLDICRTLGRDSLNALAYVLGHEMAHFQVKHSINLGFASSAQLATSRAGMEEEAERTGAFTAFLAGFDVQLAYRPILTKIYQSYRLPVQLPGYPSLAQRLQTAQRTFDALRPLYEVVRAGQLLMLTQQVEGAETAFRYLLQQYPSPELWNNRGVACLIRAIRRQSSEAGVFAYPFELDPIDRLRTGTERTRTEREEENASTGPPGQTTALLQEAVGYFQRALENNQMYTSAAINLACAYSLLENQEAAIGALVNLEQQTHQFPANGYLVKGIAYCKMGASDKARINFEKARQLQAFQGEYNWGVFKQSCGAWSEKLTDWVQDVATKLYPTNRLPYYPETADWSFVEAIDLSTGLYIAGNYPIKVKTTTRDGLIGYRILLPDASLLALETTSAFRGKTRLGIQIGSSYAKLVSTYGQPAYAFALAGNRTSYIYPQRQLIVTVHHNRVSGWQLYRID